MSLSTDKKSRQNRNTNWRDFALFGRIVSTGLLIGGYTIAGVYLARWMEGKDYPPLVVKLTPLVVVVFALWQGWLFVSQIGSKNGKKKS